MAERITDPYGYDPDAFYANVVLEGDRPTSSKLLGPDGKPLKYETRSRIGFDLTPKDE